MRDDDVSDVAGARTTSASVSPLAGLPAPAREALAEAVAALPDGIDADAAMRAVPRIAVLATNADAAHAFPTVRTTAERAELERLFPLREVEPKQTGVAYMWWSVIAFVVGLAAPALIMTARSGGAALDPFTGALPSGVGMAIALGMFILLEPGRTSSPLYRGGNFAGGVFIFYAGIWAIAAFIVARALDEVIQEPAAIIGLVLQVVSVIGCLVLSAIAIRHDRERPQGIGGRNVRTGDVPAEVAGSPEFQSGVERRLEEWRAYVFRTSSVEERAALMAAELEAVRLLAERGVLTGRQERDAIERVRDRSAWN